MGGAGPVGVRRSWLRHIRDRLLILGDAVTRRLEWGPLGDAPFRWRRALQERLNTPVPLLGSPAFYSRDLMWTVMMSQEDQHPHPNDRLLDLAIAVASVARDIDLSWLGERASPDERPYVNHWPGEHYRFLAALVEQLQPRLVVEIGSFTGLSALAMKSRLPTIGRLVTYDVVPWRQVPETALTELDFDERLDQRLADLSHARTFEAEAEVLSAADLVLLDGPKDGRFEPAFLALYVPLLRERPTVLVIDDIRFINMIQLWRDLPLPKLDLTSFGHWTGTGLVVAP